MTEDKMKSIEARIAFNREPGGMRHDMNADAIALIAEVRRLRAALLRVVEEASVWRDADAERWDQDITKPDHFVQEALR